MKSLISRRKSSIKLCFVLRLKHVSYFIILCGLIRASSNILKRIIDVYQYQFMNDKNCLYVANIDLSLCLISVFGIHLFVAMRSRLSSTDVKHPSKWWRIGVTLMLLDFPLIIFPWIMFYNNDSVISTKYINETCVTISQSLSFILWIMIQNLILNVYSLCVFVFPLIKLIKWEDKNCNMEQLSMQRYPSTESTHSVAIRARSRSGSTMDDDSLQSIVKKVVLYSTIMLISNIFVICSAAVFNAYHIGQMYILSTFLPVDMLINAWCVVLQFADIDINDIKSSFCRVMIIVCQCNVYSICGYYSKDIQIEKQNMENALQINISTPQYSSINNTTLNLPKLSLEQQKNAASNGSIPELVDIDSCQIEITGNVLQLKITPANSMCTPPLSDIDPACIDDEEYSSKL